MSSGTIILLVIIGYLILRMLLRNIKRNNRIKENDERIQKYGEEFGSQINQGKISVGMTLEMVATALGSPEKSDGKTIRENYEKEVLYYGKIVDDKNNVQYKDRVIYVNGKVAEIHEYPIAKQDL